MSEAGVPYGYCHCRCGGLAPIATRTNRRLGHVRGEPLRFIMRHHARLQPRGPRQTLAKQFWPQVDQTTTPDWCWPFIGYRNRDNYGAIKINGRMRLAHHLALELAGRTVPAGLQVNHLCDNPPCVRLDHLVFGTSQDDADDRVLGGRQASGERNGQAKLTEAQVLEILALYQRGVRGRGHRTIAKRFGVSPRRIASIVRGENWKHIPRPLPTFEEVNPSMETTAP